MDRIDAVCQLITPVPSLADIGCDHGKVSLYAANLGCGMVYACDVSARSLQKAKTLIGERDDVTFIVSDGFDNVPKVHTAVISGMGGEKIIELISRIDYRPTLILGAQHNVDKLRSYLVNNGYIITTDACLYDRGKFYDFIVAKEGSGQTLDELQLEYGVFYTKPNAHLLLRLNTQLTKLSGYKQTPENKRKLFLTQEALKWQK